MPPYYQSRFWAETRKFLGCLRRSLGVSEAFLPDPKPGLEGQQSGLHRRQTAGCGGDLGSGTVIGSEHWAFWTVASSSASIEKTASSQYHMMMIWSK